MNQSFPKKFLFSQLSAVIVGCAGFFGGLFLVMGLTGTFPSDFSCGSLIKIAFFMIACLGGSIGLMVLWGRILVMLGILLKEEAKGYPYSKPWEKDGIE